MTQFKQLTLITLLGLTFITLHCRQVETIVIDEIKTQESNADISTTKNNYYSILKVGQHGTLSPPDPLKIESIALKRLATFIYSTLVRYDQNGRIIPGLARTWEVNSGFTEFTFYLDESIFYHDSPVFLNGRGRKISTKDVKAVFERMAKSGVLPEASQMFWHIKGFDRYYYKQRMPYTNESQNQSIAGISVKNANTISITLDLPDPHFLQKLADPVSSIYPIDAINQDNNTLTHFVGTGNYAFGSVLNDSTIILKIDYSRTKQNENSMFDEIVFYFSQHESTLLNQFKQSNLELLLDIGPETHSEIIDMDSNLKEEYNINFTLQKIPNFRSWSIYYNISNTRGIGYDEAKNLIESLSDKQLLSNKLSIDSLMIFDEFEFTQTLGERSEPITYAVLLWNNESIAHSFWNYFINRSPQDISWQLNNDPFITRDVVMTIASDSDSRSTENLIKIAEFRTKHYNLVQKVTELKITHNQIPWWIIITKN